VVVRAVVGEDGVHKLHDVEHVVDEGNRLLLLPPTAHHYCLRHGKYRLYDWLALKIVGFVNL
jgi:hypothetical protein